MELIQIQMVDFANFHFQEGCRFGSGWLNEDSLRILMIMTFLSQFQDNEPNNIRYFAWLADGNDAVSWMCI